MKTISSLALTAVSLFASAQSEKSNAIQTNGYYDISYEHNLARIPHGETLNGRALDIRNDLLSLEFAEIDFSHAVRPGGFGFTAMFYAGIGPDIIHLTEPGGKNKYKLIRQAYVTYQSTGASPVTIDFGKFDTWVGYEVLDNRAQDQYSRSFNTTYSEPSYDTGFRFSKPLTDKLTGMIYLVQGWSEVEDSNKSKTWGLALSYAPNANTSILLQNHSGLEGSKHSNDQRYFGGIGFVQPGTSHVNLYNLIATIQLNPKDNFGFSADYGTSSTQPNNGKWNGEVLYARHQISAQQTASLRFDRFEDVDGLRTGLPVKLNSITGSFDQILSANFTLRFEARQDLASQAFFIGRNNELKKNRTTIAIGMIGSF